MKRFLGFLAFLLSSFIAPQRAQAQTQELVTRVVHVRSVEATKLAQLVSAGTGLRADPDDALQIVVLKGHLPAITEAEQVIKDLDVPPPATRSKDIEVTVSVIGASNKPDQSPQTAVGADLAPVVKQLKAIFPYANYRPLSSMLLRSGEGKNASTSGLMRGSFDGAADNSSNTYLILYRADLSKDAGVTSIHLRNFKFEAKFQYEASPKAFSTAPVSLTTDVDLREGQKVVIGKANVSSSDLALFIVVSARAVE